MNVCMHQIISLPSCKTSPDEGFQSCNGNITVYSMFNFNTFLCLSQFVGASFKIKYKCMKSFLTALVHCLDQGPAEARLRVWDIFDLQKTHLLPTAVFCFGWVVASFTNCPLFTFIRKSRAKYLEAKKNNKSN